MLWLVWTLKPPVGGVTRLCPPLPAAPYLRHTLGLLSITPHQEGGLTLLHTQAWDTDI